jgi:hypothetical protein
MIGLFVILGGEPCSQSSSKRNMRRECVVITVYRFGTNTVLMELYEGVSKSFRTGRLERELQVVQLSATSCIAIL